MHTLNRTNYNEDISETRHNGLYDIILIPLFIFLVVAYFGEATRAMNFVVMGMYFLCLISQLTEKRYGTFFFYLTFFLFLLGTIFFGLFDRELSYDFPSEEIERHAMLCLGIAITGVYVGSVVKWRRIVIGNNGKRFTEDAGRAQQNVSVRMKAFLRYAYLFSAVFETINALAKAIFVQANSYVAYYVDYQTPLPYFVLWFAGVSSIFYYFYLGTQPSKREVMLPTGVYLFIGIVSLFYGQRNVFFVRSIIVLCYFLIRNGNVNDDTVWISKRQMKTIIIAIPFAIIFMSFWDSFRFKETYSQSSVLEGIRRALLTQGNCLSIIDFEYRFRSVMPNKPFAIGGIISMLRNNVFARIIGIPSVPVSHGIDTALNGLSFSAALMYQQNRSGYLLGFGIGSCYIAELVNTFGYVSIFVGSMIYGAILNKLGKMKISGFMTSGFALCMFQQLLLAPRSTFDSFIVGTFQVNHLFVAVICWFLSRKVWPGEING